MLISSPVPTIDAARISPGPICRNCAGQTSRRILNRLGGSAYKSGVSSFMPYWPMTLCHGWGMPPEGLRDYAPHDQTSAGEVSEHHGRAMRPVSSTASTAIRKRLARDTTAACRRSNAARRRHRPAIRSRPGSLTMTSLRHRGCRFSHHFRPINGRVRRHTARFAA